MMRKAEVVRAMRIAGIVGEVTGSGTRWEVELVDENAKDAFRKNVTTVGGYKTGYGSWVLRSHYVSLYPRDYCDKSSPGHY